MSGGWSKFHATISLYGACSEDILVQGGLGTRVNPDTIRYMWTGEVDLNTLRIRTGKFLNLERKSCGFKNIQMHVDEVSFAAVIRVVTHRSSPLTAADSRSAFVSSNRPIRSRLPYSGNLVFGGKCNKKYDWRAANKYMHVIGSQ